MGRCRRCGDPEEPVHWVRLGVPQKHKSRLPPNDWQTGRRGLFYDPEVRLSSKIASGTAQSLPACKSKPSGADPAPNYDAAPNYGAERCPAVRILVHDPHQVLGWCRSDTVLRWFGVRSAPSQRLVQRMGATRDRKESSH